MKSKSASALCTVLVLGGCVGDPVVGSGDEAAPSEDAMLELATLDQDLVLGMEGEQVRGLHAYLARYGYLDHAELGQTYPAWRPEVGEQPEHDDVFDEQTEAAVRAFQRRSGLIETGVVDLDTRELLHMGRCGVPDNLPEIDPSSKFGEPIQPWGTRRSLTWRLANTDDGITQAAADAAVAAALASWRAESNLLFTKAATGVTADINIKFQAVDTPGGPNTEWAHNLFGTGTIVMDSTDSWSVAATTPAGKVDFQSVVLHELGHALGLQHSSITGAVMWPFIGLTQQARKPNHDDGTALSVIDDGYVSLPGINARDLSVAALSSGAVQAWGVSTAASATAFNLYRHDGASWVNDTSKAALRVTVDPTGAPWIIDGAGKVFRKNANSAAVGTWTEVPGKLANDIAIGADGSVWIVGKDGVAPNFNVHKLVSGAWVPGGSKGIHIAVSPLGIPWLVNSAGAIRRLTTSDPATGTWQALVAPNTVKDLAINAKGQPWAISTCTETNCPILAFAEQSEILYPDGRVAAAKLEKWVASPNKGVKGLAAGPTTGPWFIDSAGVVLKPVR